MSFDGSAEIPRHDQFHSPGIQLRQVYESIRMRGDEMSYPVRVRGLSGEAEEEGISDEDYASCQEAWHENGMTILRGFLFWYNNRDLVPFLQAIDRYIAFYEQRGINMFKQVISVSGLTLLYLFNGLTEKTYFTIFNEKNKDCHHLVKGQVVGGASLIFHRYHE